MDWNNRTHRIQRLKEKESFRAVVMPLSYWGAGFSALALLWEGIVKLDGGVCHSTVLVPAAFFVGLPFPLSFYRLLRGHFSKRLFA